MNRTPTYLVLLTVFIDLIGFGIIIPLLPFYALHFGATAIVIGLLSSSYSFMQFLFVPFWGQLSDRVGRRPIILMSVTGSFISYLIFGFADSLPVLFVSRILAGFMAANISTAQAYIADTTSIEDRAKYMGLIGAAFGVGFMLGPFIGGVMSRISYGAPGFLAAGLSLINAGAAFFLLPESLKIKSASRRKVSLVNIEALRFRISKERNQESCPGILLLYAGVLDPLCRVPSLQRPGLEIWRCGKRLFLCVRRIYRDNNPGWCNRDTGQEIRREVADDFRLVLLSSGIRFRSDNFKPRSPCCSRDPAGNRKRICDACTYKSDIQVCRDRRTGKHTRRLAVLLQPGTSDRTFPRRLLHREHRTKMAVLSGKHIRRRRAPPRSGSAALVCPGCRIDHTRDCFLLFLFEILGV